MAQSYQVDIVTRVQGASKIALLEKQLDRISKNSQKVQTSADKVSQSLAKLRAASFAASNGAAGVAASLTKLRAAAASSSIAIKGTAAAAKGASASVGAFGSVLTTMLGPIALVTGAIAAVGKSLAIFADRQADAAVLESSLKNLGVNGGRSLEILLDTADRLGKLTLFDQEEVTKGFNLLTSFRTIGVSSYERVATAAADMSQKLGTDLNSSLLQLAKALEAPEVGLTALQRSGTRFTEQQKEQIKTLVDSGKRLEAQK